MRWKVGIPELVHWTTPYMFRSEEQDRVLLSTWNNVVGDCYDKWGEMVGLASLFNSAEDVILSDEAQEETWFDELAAVLDEV